MKARTKQVQPVGEGIKEYDLVIGADGPQSEVSPNSLLRAFALISRFVGEKSALETKRTPNTFTSGQIFGCHSTTSDLSDFSDRRNVGTWKRSVLCTHGKR